MGVRNRNEKITRENEQAIRLKCYGQNCEIRTAQTTLWLPQTYRGLNAQKWWSPNVAYQTTGLSISRPPAKSCFTQVAGNRRMLKDEKRTTSEAFALQTLQTEKIRMENWINLKILINFINSAIQQKKGNYDSMTYTNSEADNQHLVTRLWFS